jgi:hypothetical protein
MQLCFPRRRRITDSTGLAARPLLATKRSTVGSGCDHRYRPCSPLWRHLSFQSHVSPPLRRHAVGRARGGDSVGTGVTGSTPSKFEPVSFNTGNSCRESVCRGQRRGRRFLVTPVDSGRQRLRYPGSPAAKPRKVKDYSDGARKPRLCGTGWWGW